MIPCWWSIFCFLIFCRQIRCYVTPRGRRLCPFYQPYLDALPGDDILNVLEQHGEELAMYIRSFPEELGNYAYAPGKWTAREVMLHVIDSERIFAYRALCIARGDQTPLPGFDENTYVPNCGAAGRTLESIRMEFEAVRASTLHMYINFSPRCGCAGDTPTAAWYLPGLSPISRLAMPFTTSASSRSGTINNPYENRRHRPSRHPHF